MAITTKTGRTMNITPKSILAPATPVVQTPTPVQQPTVAGYTPGTSIDNRPVATKSGNEYIAYSQRKSPTVATPSQPVISKTMNNSLVYDPSDPEDYLMKLQARSVIGKTPTEQEYYQALQAQKALQARQTTATNPLQTQIDEMIKKQQEEKALETGRDTSELDAYRQQLEQQYGNQRDELLASGERQRTAAQNVYSFSGFGRSSSAANKMTDIQKGVDSSISSLNAAKEAAIAAKKAELEGADSETLAALNSRVQQYQDAANKWQMDSLQKTAEVNQTSGASYIESLNNLMTTASKNGMDIGNPEDIQIYAQMARNPDGSINEEFVGALPEGMQAIIRTANIQQSKDAPKIENFGTTKSPRYMQRDGSKRSPVSGATQGSVGGITSRGGGTGGGSIAQDIISSGATAQSLGISENAMNVIRQMNLNGGSIDDYIKGQSKESQNLRNEVWKGLNAQGGSTTKELDILNEALGVVQQMKDNNDYKEFGYSTLFGGKYLTSYGDMKLRADQINAILTKDNLGLMKGVLSESDVAMLKAMSGGLLEGGVISDTTAKERIDSIYNKLNKRIQDRTPKSTAPANTTSTGGAFFGKGNIR